MGRYKKISHKEVGIIPCTGDFKRYKIFPTVSKGFAYLTSVINLIVGLLITAAGLPFLDEIIWRLGASEILFPYCKDY